jgi:hypothetical protein
MNKCAMKSAVKRLYACGCCGYIGLGEPQRSASGGASHEICQSCGFESGFTDDVEGYDYAGWLEQWRAGGMKWFSKKRPRARRRR